MQKPLALYFICRNLRQTLISRRFNCSSQNCLAKESRFIKSNRRKGQNIEIKVHSATLTQPHSSLRLLNHPRSTAFPNVHYNRTHHAGSIKLIILMLFSCSVICSTLFSLFLSLSPQKELVKPPLAPSFISTPFTPTPSSLTPTISVHSSSLSSSTPLLSNSSPLTAAMPHHPRPAAPSTLFAASFLRPAPGPIRTNQGSILFAPY